MKYNFIAIILLFIAGCQANKQEVTNDGDISFYVGSYTTEESKGIYKYLLREDGSLQQIGLVAVTDNPSFLELSADKRFLLAVNENNIEGTGSVTSYLIKDDSLKLISQRSSGGAHPCFISVNKSGFVLVANYTGGNVGLLKLNKTGELTDLLHVQQHDGQGTTKRQLSPHAHACRC